MNHSRDEENLPRQRLSSNRTETFQNINNNIRRRWVQKNLKERIYESLPIFIIGSILIFSGTCLLFWNEGQAVYTTRSLDEGYNSVLSIQNSDVINGSSEGKLVHVWGALSVIEPLQDPYYGIMVKAVKLKRRVQVYQWVEEESTFSTGDPGDVYDVSYSYTQMWKDKLIDSLSFYETAGHENPTNISVPSVIQTSEIVKVGAYYISPAVKETFQKFISFSADEPPESDDMKLHNGMYYLTKDIFNPEIGDIRIQFYFSGHDDEVVTIIGKQVDDGLHPYVTSSGKQLLLVQAGKLSIEEMFFSEHAQNRWLTWINRLLGWFLIFIGLMSINSIIHYLVLLSPLLRDIVHLGLGSANLTLSMSLSLILIGGAWCFYRPGLALFIVMVAALPMIRALFSRRETRATGRAQPGGV